MAIFEEFAPAKINLTLDVLGKRPDGYHELKSLVAFADVGDVVRLDTSMAVGVTTSGPFAASIAGANLIDTTLQLIARAAPDLKLGAVHLEKNLPVAAGIGGGSADAAAVIRAVRATNAERNSSVDWQALALKLGADVPVCLARCLSWMTGLGEGVAPLYLGSVVRLPAVIVNPLVPVPADKTAQVFRALRAEPLPAGFIAPQPKTALYAAEDVLAEVFAGKNSLEPAARAVVPAVEEVLASLTTARGGMLARMSGGGPTCFALFQSDDAAQSAAASLSTAHPAWWVRATSLG